MAVNEPQQPKRRRRKPASDEQLEQIAQKLNGGDADATNEHNRSGNSADAGAVNPPQNSADWIIQRMEAKRRKRTRRRNPQATENKQLKAAMKRIGIATEGLGPNAAEIFKTATLQVVQAKLSEIYELLRLIGGNGRAFVSGASPQESRSINGSPPASEPMTLETVEQKIARADAAARAQQQNRAGGETCRICGYPAVMKTDKGMPVCRNHAGEAIEMSQGDIVRRKMNAAFGSGSGDVDIIKVNAEGQVIG